MGYFELIRQRRYEEFCKIYREKAHLCRTMPEKYGDVLPGNYMYALLGLGKCAELIPVCQEQIQLEREASVKFDRSSNYFWNGLSIACLQLGQYGEMAEAIRSAVKAAYQDLSRTESPCLMYWEAVIAGDEALKKDAKRLLRTCLRAKGAAAPDFASARFLLEKIGEAELRQELRLIEIEALYFRALSPAVFSIAVKRLEHGDAAGFQAALEEVQGLYSQNPIVTMTFAYYLAELRLTGSSGRFFP